MSLWGITGLPPQIIRRIGIIKYYLHKPIQKHLAHQDCTIAIASDFRVDKAKSPEIPQKEGVLGSEIAVRIANRKRLSIASLNCNAALLPLVSEIAAISGVRDGHRNCKSQKSLQVRCTKQILKHLLQKMSLLSRLIAGPLRT